MPFNLELTKLILELFLFVFQDVGEIAIPDQRVLFKFILTIVNSVGLVS